MIFQKKIIIEISAHRSSPAFYTRKMFLWVLKCLAYKLLFYVLGAWKMAQEQIYDRHRHISGAHAQFPAKLIILYYTFEF